MANDQLPAAIVPTERRLTTAEFHQLADVPPEVAWFANITNPNTRRAYEYAVGDFMRFAGDEGPYHRLARRDSAAGVVRIRVTPKTRNSFIITALSISGVTRKWHFLNHAQN